MRLVYVTADQIVPGTGGGHVTANELEALRGLGEVKVISAEHISPLSRFGIDSPFLADHLAADVVWGMEGVKLAQLYSGTFTSTVRALKAKGSKVSYTSPFHDRRVSMDEFTRLGMDYPYPHIKDDRLWKVFIGGLLEADVVIAPSHLAAEGLRAVGCQTVEVIPHGCVIPEKVVPLPERFTVGFLSQPGPDKGVTYLITAWARLNYRDSTLLLGGQGTDGLGTLIQRGVNGGQFRLLGYVQNPSDFYASISVLCAPSVVEAFGITILEAMAHGRPVVVSAGAGASELVEHGVEGFVVPIRSPDAIAERLEWLRAHPNRMVEMGQAAREKARGYTWEMQGGRYQALWNSLLSRG